MLNPDLIQKISKRYVVVMMMMMMMRGRRKEKKGQDRTVIEGRGEREGKM